MTDFSKLLNPEQAAAATASHAPVVVRHPALSVRSGNRYVDAALPT